MTTTTVDVREFQNHLDEYLEKAVAGETVVVLRENQPIVEVQGVRSGAVHSERPSGLARGEFVVPDDFEESLANDVMCSHG